MLLHQFLAGIPEFILKQVRASGEVTTLDMAITHAKLLMTINSDTVATLTEKTHTIAEKPDELQLLREQVVILTEQVAVLSTNQPRGPRPPRSRPRYFHCNQVGHLQRDCCSHKCSKCGRLRHLSKDSWHQGNDNRVPVQGNRCPYQ